MLVFSRTHCIHAAYVTVILYESSWWPVGAPTGHHELFTVTLPYAACIQFVLLKMSI